MRRLIPGAVLGALSLIVIGAAGGMAVLIALSTASTPESLQSSPPLTSVPVTLKEFDDPHAVEIAVEIEPASGVVVPRGGVVSAWTCSEGAELTSGSSSIAIDGEHMLTLATAVPLWRDLERGSKGADVGALEDELARAGYSVTRDTVLSADEMGAVTTMAAAASVHLEGRLPRDLVLWIPRSPAVIESCEMSLGMTASPGDVAAKVDAGVSLSPISVPDSALAGSRNLELFDEPIELSESWEPSEDVSSSAIKASRVYREAAASSPDMTALTLKGRVVLREAVQVAAVPASAVKVAPDSRECVYVEGKPLAVTVVGSELGTTFVLFTKEDHPSSVDLIAPSEATCS